MKKYKKINNKISLYLIAKGISVPHYCYHNGPILSLTLLISFFAFYKVALVGCFVYLNLTTWISSELLSINWGFMLDSLTADNFVQMFEDWDNLNLCSYLLLNLWSQIKEKVKSKKLEIFNFLQKKNKIILLEKYLTNLFEPIFDVISQKTIFIFFIIIWAFYFSSTKLLIVFFILLLSIIFIGLLYFDQGNILIYSIFILFIYAFSQAPLFLLLYFAFSFIVSTGLYCFTDNKLYYNINLLTLLSFTISFLVFKFFLLALVKHGLIFVADINKLNILKDIECLTINCKIVTVFSSDYYNVNQGIIIFKSNSKGIYSFVYNPAITDLAILISKYAPEDYLFYIFFSLKYFYYLFLICNFFSIKFCLIFSL